MPLYDYRCGLCGVDFEVRQSFTDDTLTLCPPEGGPPACAAPGEGPVKKVFTRVGISFKGDGFYKNDHGSNAAGRRKESQAASKTASSASESGSPSPKKSSRGEGSSSKSSGGASKAAAASGSRSSSR